MKLAVTIDVEEEGLFRTEYHSGEAPASNVPRLELLDRVFREFAIRPTLLVSYQAARSASNQRILSELAGRWRGEIGAHLHPWNTPPLQPLPYPEPVPSELIPKELLAAKLENLIAALKPTGVDPVSFRMGRFNMGPRMLSVLEESQIKVDSSVCPMRTYYGGPAHLSAPTDPYFPDGRNVCRSGSSEILEVPLTVLPVVPGLGSALEALERTGTVPRAWISRFAMDLGSLPAQPYWTGLRRLKIAVRLHRLLGGRVLCVFFHSSELLPGASPRTRTERDVERFIDRLRLFFSWLVRKVSVESITLSELRGSFHRSGTPTNRGEE
jgi:hypothetical protein